MRHSGGDLAILQRPARNNLTVFRIVGRSLSAPLGRAHDHLDYCVLTDACHGEGSGGRVGGNLVDRAYLGHRVRYSAAGGDNRVEHGGRGRADRLGVYLELRGARYPEQAAAPHSRNGGGRSERWRVYHERRRHFRGRRNRRS